MFVSGIGYVRFAFARIWATSESNWLKLGRLSISESGLHAGGEVVNFHGYDHKIEHTTALGLAALAHKRLPDESRLAG